MLGIEAIPSQSTLSRFFARCGRRAGEALSGLHRWALEEVGQRYDTVLLDASQPRGWAFTLEGETRHLRPGGRFDCSDGQVLHQWCLLGLGIAWRSMWEVGQDVASGRLVSVLDAYAAKDVAAAVDVWNRDEEVDEHYNAIFRELLTYMMGDPRTINACAHLLFVAKNLERIGDHATNIAEIIHFEITGEEIVSKRPKLDTPR